MEDVNVGEKVKEYRLAKKMSLRELAEKTGVSPSMISQIENNTANPSINTLKCIAYELQIPLYKFFQNDEAHDKLIVRKGEYKLLGHAENEVQYKLLTQDVDGAIECCLMDIPAHGISAAKAYGHIGEEVSFVISGQTDVYVSGIKYHLNEGDAIRIPPTAPHRWENNSDEPVRVIFSITPPSF